MKLERFLFAIGFIVVTGTFLFFAATGQTSSIPSTSPQAETRSAASAVASNKQITFNDEFDGTILNSNNWATCYDWRKPSETGCTNESNAEQEWYADSQLRVLNGQLVITAAKNTIDVVIQNQAKTFAYRSGMISSGRGTTSGTVRWAGTYGYYEARLKFQDGQGIAPAFWLAPIDQSWTPEIDIMQFNGNKPAEIAQSLQWKQNGQPQKSGVVVKGQKNYSGDWHTYGVDWRPDGIDWYIDGVKTGSYVGAHVPSEPMQIVLNLAVGGISPGKADGSTPFPSQLYVDYIRVYQSKDQIRPHQY